MHSAVLVINCGSSSVKFSCIEAGTQALLCGGMAEKLLTEAAVVTIELGDETTKTAMPMGGHAEAISAIYSALQQAGIAERIAAVGHRVVHGAEAFKSSVVITDAVLDTIERCASFAPLHNPANLLGIKMMQQLAPHWPQVAVFDTAFHQTLPPEAFLYGVPMPWYRDFGVRRYGFHGSSHRFVCQQAAHMLGIPLSNSAFITAHLGNGSSAAAILNGKSVDTTMGFTPLEGLVMGTRSGDVDAGLLPYLATSLQMSTNEVIGLLNTKSGLLGLSGLSNDMRTLSEAASSGNAGAALAIEVFVFRLAKAIGALAISLPRLDALVFTGGIGENSVMVRSKTLARLSILGFEEDATQNALCIRGRSGTISSAASTTALVANTNEELMIATDTLRVLAERVEGLGD
ncbi:MAG: acetate kinase [Bacteroidetes bacterium]|nr:MAG: acetate kinase [Bacteroidota bacterium]